MGEAGGDLADLLRLVTDGSVELRIGWRGSWEHFTAAAEALRERRVFGRAVLDFQPPNRRTAEALELSARGRPPPRAA